MRFSVIASVLASCLVLSGVANGETVKTEAGFAMPLQSDNWKADIFGRNGLYRFRQTTGNCQVTFSQSLGAVAARAAGRGPQSSIDGYVDRFFTKVGKATRNKAPSLEISATGAGRSRFSGEKVTFLSEEIAYTGVNNVPYHMRIWSQWVGNVEMLIIAACPSTEWNRSQDLLAGFLNEVSILVPRSE